MDIESLNRTQIILLTLLISFVTSIATGIVTVSLLEQAPQSVTQTINRVVERTVEQVAPAIAQIPSTVTKETTVVVNQDDQVSAAIEKDRKSVVGIYQKSRGDDGAFIYSFVGWGVVLTKEGIIGTDSGIILDAGAYSITASDGKSFDTKTLSQDETLGVALLAATGADPKYAFFPAALGNPDVVKLGQSVIAFGGFERLAIGVGVVSDITPLLRSQTGTTTPATITGYIDASVAPPASARGGPLATLTGDIVGIAVGDKATRFASRSLFSEKLSALSAAPK